MGKIVALLLVISGLWGEHVVIHMDLNRTIIASDIRQDQGIDQVLNLSLAKKYVESWDGGRPMNYYDYIYDVVYPGERRDQALRRVRRDAINDFVEWLGRKGHPLYEVCLAEKKEAHSVMKDKLIFPAFTHLLERLEEEKVSYTLVFRTFGHDFDRVEKALGWNIPRARFSDGRLVTDRGELTKAEEIYRFIKKYKHLAIQDDYFYWNRHNEHFEYGKQFPLDLDGEVFSIFFDDNVEPIQKVNIVAPIDVNSGKYLIINDLVRGGQVVPVVTIDAINDHTYFSKCIPGLAEYRGAHVAMSQPAAQ